MLFYWPLDYCDYVQTTDFSHPNVKFLWVPGRWNCVNFYICYHIHFIKHEVPFVNLTVIYYALQYLIMLRDGIKSGIGILHKSISNSGIELGIVHVDTWHNWSCGTWELWHLGIVIDHIGIGHFGIGIDRVRCLVS